MRRLAITSALGFVAAAAASVAFAGSGDTTKRHARPSYADAAARTLRATSERFSIDVTIVKNLRTVALHLNGAEGPGKLKLRLRLEDAKLGEGAPVPGVAGAVLIDGPFLYEHAPSGMVVGKLQWLRERLSELDPSAENLRNIRAMTPRSLLAVLGVARIRPTADRFVYAGWLPFDDPAVEGGLGPLTGDVQFRSLHAHALLGRDGRVHRIRITGKTADGRTTLTLLAHMYAFDRPVKVKAPPMDAFLDPKRELLSN